MNPSESCFLSFRLTLLLLVLPTLTGCAILRLPFDILNGVWQIVRQLPMPPPGVF